MLPIDKQFITLRHMYSAEVRIRLRILDVFVVMVVVKFTKTYQCVPDALIA